MKPLASLAVDVLDAGSRPRAGRTPCHIGTNLTFTTELLESYCLREWEPIIYDALIVMGAVEFCDRIFRRPVQHWGREIELRIPVHEPERWNASEVSRALHDALCFVTGDRWSLSFIARRTPFTLPKQVPIPIASDIDAVIPFSDGLDSCAVAGLMHKQMGDRMMRVRLGTKRFCSPESTEKQPFTSIPYKVKRTNSKFVESSARSRGFKFAMVSGLAAYLVQANRIIVPESGQGALGPALVPVGQTYEDYRNHPMFMSRMEKVLFALYGRRICYAFPRIWYTKGETLDSFVKECCDGPAWATTWSCWQPNYQVSVEHKKRQCGVCAACQLRRMSVHAAGLSERPDTYVWENLKASSFNEGAAGGFTHVLKAQYQYAIAGTLHLAELSALQEDQMNNGTIKLAASQLAKALSLTESEAGARLARLLSQHKREWNGFLDALGESSFIVKWTRRS
ncbi:ATPase [Ahniella affigens]|uniref:ATPase n=2 Tax=Ahniella affigens TaxID=2021234 RepID=A0A2P1PRE9_9GAMM|nr:ATPase [Ahniella affigens]